MSARPEGSWSGAVRKAERPLLGIENLARSVRRGSPPETTAMRPRLNHCASSARSIISIDSGRRRMRARCHCQPMRAAPPTDRSWLQHRWIVNGHSCDGGYAPWLAKKPFLQLVAIEPEATPCRCAQPRQHFGLRGSGLNSALRFPTPLPRRTGSTHNPAAAIVSNLWLRPSWLRRASRPAPMP